MSICEHNSDGYGKGYRDGYKIDPLRDCESIASQMCICEHDSDGFGVDSPSTTVNL